MKQKISFIRSNYQNQLAQSAAGKALADMLAIKVVNPVFREQMKWLVLLQGIALPYPSYPTWLINSRAAEIKVKASHLGLQLRQECKIKTVQAILPLAEKPYFKEDRFSGGIPILRDNTLLGASAYCV